MFPPSARRAGESASAGGVPSSAVDSSRLGSAALPARSSTYAAGAGTAASSASAAAAGLSLGAHSMRSPSVAWPDSHPDLLSPSHSERRADFAAALLGGSNASTSNTQAHHASTHHSSTEATPVLQPLRAVLPHHGLSVPTPSTSSSSTGNSPGLSGHAAGALSALNSSSSALLSTLNSSGVGANGSGALTPAKAKLNQFILDLVKNQVRITDDFSALCRSKIREKDSRLHALQLQLHQLTMEKDTLHSEYVLIKNELAQVKKQHLEQRTENARLMQARLHDAASAPTSVSSSSSADTGALKVHYESQLDAALLKQQQSYEAILVQMKTYLTEQEGEMTRLEAQIAGIQAERDAARAQLREEEDRATAREKKLELKLQKAELAQAKAKEESLAVLEERAASSKGGCCRSILGVMFWSFLLTALLCVGLGLKLEHSALAPLFGMAPHTPTPTTGIAGMPPHHGYAPGAGLAPLPQQPCAPCVRAPCTSQECSPFFPPLVVCPVINATEPTVCPPFDVETQCPICGPSNPITACETCPTCAVAEECATCAIAPPCPAATICAECPLCPIFDPAAECSAPVECAAPTECAAPVECPPAITCPPEKPETECPAPVECPALPSVDEFSPLVVAFRAANGKDESEEEEGDEEEELPPLDVPLVLAAWDELRSEVETAHETNAELRQELTKERATFDMEQKAWKASEALNLQKIAELQAKYEDLLASQTVPATPEVVATTEPVEPAVEVEVKEAAPSCAAELGALSMVHRAMSDELDVLRVERVTQDEALANSAQQLQTCRDAAVTLAESASSSGEMGEDGSMSESRSGSTSSASSVLELHLQSEQLKTRLAEMTLEAEKTAGENEQLRTDLTAWKTNSTVWQAAHHEQQLAAIKNELAITLATAAAAIEPTGAAVEESTPAHLAELAELRLSLANMTVQHATLALQLETASSLAEELEASRGEKAAMQIELDQLKALDDAKAAGSEEEVEELQQEVAKLKAATEVSASALATSEADMALLAKDAALAATTLAALTAARHGGDVPSSTPTALATILTTLIGPLGLVDQDMLYEAEDGTLLQDGECFADTASYFNFEQMARAECARFIHTTSDQGKHIKAVLDAWTEVSHPTIVPCDCPEVVTVTAPVAAAPVDEDVSESSEAMADLLLTNPELRAQMIQLEKAADASVTKAVADAQAECATRVAGLQSEFAGAPFKPAVATPVSTDGAASDCSALERTLAEKDEVIASQTSELKEAEMLLTSLDAKVKAKLASLASGATAKAGTAAQADAEQAIEIEARLTAMEKDTVRLRGEIDQATKVVLSRPASSSSGPIGSSSVVQGVPRSVAESIQFASEVWTALVSFDLHALQYLSPLQRILTILIYVLVDVLIFQLLLPRTRPFIAIIVVAWFGATSACAFAQLWLGMTLAATNAVLALLMFAKPDAALFAVDVSIGATKDDDEPTVRPANGLANGTHAALPPMPMPMPPPMPMQKPPTPAAASTTAALPPMPSPMRPAMPAAQNAQTAMPPMPSPMPMSQQQQAQPQSLPPMMPSMPKTQAQAPAQVPMPAPAPAPSMPIMPMMPPVSNSPAKPTAEVTPQYAAEQHFEQEPPPRSSAPTPQPMPMPPMPMPTQQHQQQQQAHLPFLPPISPPGEQASTEVSPSHHAPQAQAFAMPQPNGHAFEQYAPVEHQQHQPPHHFEAPYQLTPEPPQDHQQHYDQQQYDQQASYPQPPVAEAVAPQEPQYDQQQQQQYQQHDQASHEFFGQQQQQEQHQQYYEQQAPPDQYAGVDLSQHIEQQPEEVAHDTDAHAQDQQQHAYDQQQQDFAQAQAQAQQPAADSTGDFFNESQPFDLAPSSQGQATYPPLDVAHAPSGVSAPPSGTYSEHAAAAGQFESDMAAQQHQQQQQHQQIHHVEHEAQQSRPGFSHQSSLSEVSEPDYSMPSSLEHTPMHTDRSFFDGQHAHNQQQIDLYSQHQQAQMPPPQQYEQAAPPQQYEQAPVHPAEQASYPDAQHASFPPASAQEAHPMPPVSAEYLPQAFPAAAPSLESEYSDNFASVAPTPIVLSPAEKKAAKRRGFGFAAAAAAAAQSSMPTYSDLATFPSQAAPSATTSMPPMPSYGLPRPPMPGMPSQSFSAAAPPVASAASLESNMDGTAMPPRPSSFAGYGQQQQHAMPPPSMGRFPMPAAFPSPEDLSSP